ncbi:MAG: adenylyl-sulfate kinase [Methylotenera sp. 17-45-7]|nr:MAG: adenylyl-sulfate kinase [Methylotenera sp. 17-45-7]OZA53891.1 MAG: adenylyl-sulfate kinase [Methylophilales bacterium 39-45-7]
MMKNKNILWQDPLVKRAERNQRNGHKSVVLWLTGFSGAGKSTLAHAIERRLYEQDCATFVLDGDNVRHGLCNDLGFTQQDREENIRRVGEMAKLFTEAGVIAITAFISPYIADRERVRSILPAGEFVEIYCRCALDICESRDVKGLYAKARKGLISDFTGISSPYEPPQNPELTVDTGTKSLDECAEQVIDYLRQQQIIGQKT